MFKKVFIKKYWLSEIVGKLQFDLTYESHQHTTFSENLLVSFNTALIVYLSRCLCEFWIQSRDIITGLHMQFLLIGCCPLLDLRLSLLHNGTKIESHLPKTTLYFIFHIKKELVKKATTVVASHLIPSISWDT